MCYTKLMKTKPTKTAFDELVARSYRASIGSKLALQEKRCLVFSLYSFFCLFDARQIKRHTDTLSSVGCCFIEPGEALKDEPGAVKLNKKNGVAYKFDVGSELFFKRISEGRITDEFALYPEKLNPFEAVDTLIHLPEAELNLKALWYLYYPLLFVEGLKTDFAFVARARKALADKQIFKRLFRYEEAFDPLDAADTETDARVKDWYAPYLDYGFDRTRGDKRPIILFLSAAYTRKEFDKVLRGSERLLDYDPYDESAGNLNFTARMMLVAVLDGEAQVRMIQETEALCSEAILEGRKNPEVYYLCRGMCKMVRGDLDAAEDDFKSGESCNPSFTAPSYILEQLEKQRKQ